MASEKQLEVDFEIEFCGVSSSSSPALATRLLKAGATRSAQYGRWQSQLKWQQMHQNH